MNITMDNINKLETDFVLKAFQLLDVLSDSEQTMSTHKRAMWEAQMVVWVLKNPNTVAIIKEDIDSGKFEDMRMVDVVRQFKEEYNVPMVVAHIFFRTMFYKNISTDLYVS